MDKDNFRLGATNIGGDYPSSSKVCQSQQPHQTIATNSISLNINSHTQGVRDRLQSQRGGLKVTKVFGAEERIKSYSWHKTYVELTSLHLNIHCPWSYVPFFVLGYLAPPALEKLPLVRSIYSTALSCLMNVADKTT